MLKTVRKLVDQALSNPAVPPVVIGNHSFQSYGDIWFFHYHRSPVCIVRPHEGTYSLSDCGWNTPSTNRTLRSYSEALDKLYRRVEREGHYPR